MNLRFNFHGFLDFLFILSYSVGYVSLLKYVTYAIFPIPESIALFIFLTIVYKIRFGGKNNTRRIIKGYLLYYLIFFFTWEIIQGIVVGTEIKGILVALFNLLSTYVAYKYFNNIIQSKLGIEHVIHTYSLYMYYTIFIVFLSSFLLLSSVISPYANVLSGNSLMNTNMETMGGQYYFPGYLSVVYQTPSIFLSRFNFPSLSGLSHESQAMYYTIYPALFLQFANNTSKKTEKIVIILFLLTTILTTSLTAVMCFILTYTMHLLWKFNDRRQRVSAVLILLFTALILVYFINSQFNIIFRTFFLEKANFDSAGSSGSYSLNLLTYIISPSGLLGQGIFSPTSEQALGSSLNCGYLSSVMIIGFYVLFLLTCIRNIFTNNIMCHAIGLASFYFITHSFKYGIQIFNSNYIFFIVFLLTYADFIRRKYVTKSL